MIDQFSQAEKVSQHNEQFQPLKDSLHPQVDLDAAYEDAATTKLEQISESPRDAIGTLDKDVTQTAEVPTTPATSELDTKPSDTAEKLARIADKLTELNRAFASILHPYEMYKNSLQNRELLIHIQSGRFDLNKLSMDNLGENIRTAQRMLLETTQFLDDVTISDQEKVSVFKNTKQSVDFAIQSVQSDIYFAIMEMNRVAQDLDTQQDAELTQQVSQLQQTLSGLQTTADSFLEASAFLSDQESRLSDTEPATV